MVLLIASLGFSQELVTNGDFETGVAGDWYSGGDNSVDIVDDGSTTNFVHQVNVMVANAGEPWRVNLSQIVALSDNTAYTLTFDAYTDATTENRFYLGPLASRRWALSF